MTGRHVALASNSRGLHQHTRAHKKLLLCSYAQTSAGFSFHIKFISCIFSLHLRFYNALFPPTPPPPQDEIRSELREIRSLLSSSGVSGKGEAGLRNTLPKENGRFPASGSTGSLRCVRGSSSLSRTNSLPSRVALTWRRLSECLSGGGGADHDTIERSPLNVSSSEGQASSTLLQSKTSACLVGSGTAVGDSLRDLEISAVQPQNLERRGSGCRTETREELGLATTAALARAALESSGDTTGADQQSAPCLLEVVSDLVPIVAISSCSAPSAGYEAYTIDGQDPVNSIVPLELVLQPPLHPPSADTSILLEMATQPLLTGNTNIIPRKEYEAWNTRTCERFEVAGLGSNLLPQNTTMMTSGGCRDEEEDWEPDSPVSASPTLYYLPAQAACLAALDMRANDDTAEGVASQFLSGNTDEKTC